MEQPLLLCLNYTSNKQSFYKKVLSEANITQLTFIQSIGKSGSKLLNLLGLGDLEREIVLAISDLLHIKEVYHLLEKYDDKKDKLSFSFTIPVERAIGLTTFENYVQEGSNVMQKAMFIIVDRGQADRVINLTNALGATGATILNARGSGIFLEKKFNLEIEPEKEIILIVTNGAMEEKIAGEIATKLELGKPNKGILFSIPVVETFGIK